jgi:hypothetical protein
MSWFKKVSPPPSNRSPFPRRIDVVPGTLSVTISLHEVAIASRTLSLWSYVTDGLARNEHAELIVSIVRAPREDANDSTASSWRRCE